MPITQERMLALLDEAEQARRAYDGLISDLGRALADPDVCFVMIELVVKNAPTLVMPRAAIERAHFTRVRAKNVRNANNMARYRGARRA